ncbi:disulfide bond formation protein DsbA [bacterium]|nr:disulfide bond formation protein DsbA [bacterium]
MTEPTTTTTSTPSGVGSSNQNQMGVPLAIVIAGALIALAVYFGNGTGSAPTTAVALEGEQAPAAAPTAPSIGDIRPVSSDDHVRGAANAKITVIEYSDYECPFCKRFHPTMQQLITEYPNDVQWVYRHFPLEQLHRQANAEAEASECASEQGRFWEFTDIVYEETTSNDGLDLSLLPTYAQQAGVTNIAQFTSCVESGKYADKVAADIADAQAAGGRGTPYSVVIGPNGEKLPINGAQPYASVKATIDQLL